MARGADSRKRRSRGGTASYDSLLAIRDRRRAEELIAVTFSVDDSGQLWVTQHTRGGQAPKIRVGDANLPFSIDLSSPTGGEYGIEARFFGNDTTLMKTLGTDFEYAGGSHIPLPGDFFEFSSSEE